jgi:competence protein ComEA
MNPTMRPKRAQAIRAFLLALLLALATGGQAAAASELSGVVNVNTATAEELALLPGVGAVKAQAILEARQDRGSFRSVEELLEVRGIGPAALERIRSHVVLEGRTTLGRE